MLKVVRPADVDTTTITDEQIGRCSKVLHKDGNFFLVQSESDELKEYKVSFDKKLGMQCSCPAGQKGFIYCRKGYCKHVAWALATEQEVRQALVSLEKQAEDAYLDGLVKCAIQAEEQHQAEQAKKPVKPRRSRWDKRYENNRGFQLLK